MGKESDSRSDTSETSHTSVLGNWSFDLQLPTQVNIEEQKNKFVKHSFLAVIKYCIDKLVMLPSTYSAFADCVPIMNLDYRTLEERFSNINKNWGEHKINAEYTDMHKVQKDVSMIVFLLLSLVEEAKTSDSCSRIKTLMENCQKMYADEEQLIQEVEQKRHLIGFMRWTYVKEKNATSTMMISVNGTIKDAMIHFQEQTEYTKDEVNYAKRWQDARFEQNHIRLELKEKAYTSTKEIMDYEIEQEIRCHGELCNYILESQNDLMQEIQFWMNQYEKQMENKETEIFNLNMDAEKLSDKLEALRMEYDERAQAMKDWLAHKRKKAEAEDRVLYETWAATTIQGWWRAVMIKKRLGPYRKHKGKKGKKGKKDKKK